MHAFGAHLPLEKCKKPRTGRGFLRIDRGRADDPFRYIGFSILNIMYFLAFHFLLDGGGLEGTNGLAHMAHIRSLFISGAAELAAVTGHRDHLAFRRLHRCGSGKPFE